MKTIPIRNMNLQEVNPIDFGEEVCSPGHSYGPKTRTYYLLHYVRSGKGVFFRNGVCNTVRKGQIFVIRPYEVTLYRADMADPWEYIWIGFESSLDIPAILSQDVITVPECEHVFASVIRFKKMNYSRELYLCGKIYELLAIINEKYEETQGENSYVTEAQEYIEANYNNKFTVQDIADHLSLDRCYFSTLFKNSVGKPPQQYILDFRLEKAAELLSNHKVSVQEAAQSCGYFDIYNFSKMFKKKFGVSPRNYKNSVLP